MGSQARAARRFHRWRLYWLDELEATSESLRKLAERGLWPESSENTQRRAEGFNHLAIACWRDA
jgi:CRISPR-associated protein Cmr3